MLHLKSNLISCFMALISCDQAPKQATDPFPDSTPTKPIVLREFSQSDAVPESSNEPQVIVINRAPKEDKKPEEPEKVSSTEPSTIPDPKIPQESPKPDPPPVGENKPMDLQAGVTNIFAKYCVACHSATNIQGNFGNLDNLDSLIGSGRYIVPQQPDQSLLFNKLAPRGNMPPSGILTADEIDLIRQWILQLKPISNKQVSFSEVLRLMRTDLQTLAPSDQSQIRYFTLDVSNNAQVSAETLELLRLSLGKTLNSLSSAIGVQVMTPIDKNRLIYRVRLGDFGISPRVFESVIKSYYPYGMALNSGPVGNLTQEMIQNDTALRELTGSQVYSIRIDWFVATATLPIPYEILLGQGLNQNALDLKLGVDRARAIAANQVMRSGFKSSGISSQNRIIERMEQSNGRSYWQSYDFAFVEKNIFEAPLGPIGTHPTRVFDHDGGEVIYQLPNGLFGYRLVNKNGDILDKGPTSIVKQNDAPPQFLAAVVNGVSCMNCHGAGYLPKADEILDFMVQNRGDFLADEVLKISRLYPENRFLAAAMAKDNALYFEALKKIGIDPQKPDPINQTYRHYNRSLSKVDLAAELGTTSKTIEVILGREPFKTKWQGVMTNGVISREEFNRLLPQAWSALHQGETSLIFPEVGDFLVTVSCMFANQLQMDGCLIDNRTPPPPTQPVPATVQ